MKVLINETDRPELASRLEGLPLGDALRELGRVLDRDGLLMTGLDVDGQTLTGADRSAVEGRTDVGELRVEARSPVELVRQTLALSREWVPPLKREIFACAGRFRSGDDSVAIESLLQVIEGLRLLLTGAAQVQRLSELRVPDLPLKALRDFQQAMSSHLDELIEAQEARDWILLADLLEYDVAERLDGWEAVAVPLEDALEGGDGRS